MKPSAPQTRAELVMRAEGLLGWSVGELAASLGLHVPAEPLRGKGFIGKLIETALGASAGSLDEPDFPDLGIELKTLPVNPNGQPRESTFLCTATLTEFASAEWTTSRAKRKLAQILWVFVESAPHLEPSKRRIGRAVLWKPTTNIERILEDDWSTIAGLVAVGKIDEVTGHIGTYMQLRPKAAHSRVTTLAPDDEGALQPFNPRGFYLRTALTKQIIRETMSS